MSCNNCRANSPGAAYPFVVLTISDKGALGKRKDTSGPKVVRILIGIGMGLAGHEILPDDYDLILSKLIHYADVENIPLIITTGGTGFSPRDVTPEATSAAIERIAPGISEAMRIKTLEFTPNAMLSRGVSGIRGKTLIINLPGSEKAVAECLEVILPALPHALKVLSGVSVNCGEKSQYE